MAWSKESARATKVRYQDQGWVPQKERRLDHGWVPRKEEYPDNSWVARRLAWVRDSARTDRSLDESSVARRWDDETAAPRGERTFTMVVQRLERSRAETSSSTSSMMLWKTTVGGNSSTMVGKPKA